MNTTDAVRTLLVKNFGIPEATPDDAALFSDDILNSLNSVQLLMLLESEFAISISPLDVTLEDLDGIDKIAGTVERLRAA